MKPASFRLIAVALLAAVIGVAETFAEPQRSIRITTGEWPPYTSATMPFYGLASHIVTEAFAEVDVVTDYGFFPWTRAMKLARDGHWDGTSIWFDTHERRERFFYSDPIITATNSFFFLVNSKFDWEDFQDLKNLRVGGTLEYSYGKEFDMAEEAGVFHTQRSRSDEAGLRNLLKSRIDVFPGELIVTYEQIEANFSPQEAALITHHPRPISVQPLYLLLSKSVPENEKMLELFNEGLRRLKERGRYGQIMAETLSGKRAVRR